jgi:hypothetical protein
MPYFFGVIFGIVIYGDAKRKMYFEWSENSRRVKMCCVR